MFNRRVWILLFFYSLSVSAEVPQQKTFPCQTSSDERLLTDLTETQQRLSCKASLGIGAACAGIAAGVGASAVTAKIVASKLEQKSIATLLSKAATLQVKISSSSAGVQYYAKNANQNDSDIKSTYNKHSGLIDESKKAEQELAEVMKQLAAKDPKKIVETLKVYETSGSKLPNTSTYARSVEETLDLLRKLALQTYGSNANDSAKIAQTITDSIAAAKEAAYSASRKVGQAVAAQVAERASLRFSLEVGKRVLGSRFFAFLGGTAATGLSLAVYSPNLGCGDLYAKYITVDENCNPKVDVNENVENFLSMPPDDQLNLLRSDSRICNFYLGLEQKLKLDDQPDEQVLKEVQNLSCGQNISFQLVDGKNISSYEVSAKDGSAQALKNVDTQTRIGFTQDGNVGQYCEMSSTCESIQSGAGKKVAEKVLGTISHLRFAASEAIKCCETSKTDCALPASASSSPSNSSTGSGNSSTDGSTPQSNGVNKRN